MSKLRYLFQLPSRREERFIALVRPHIDAMYRMAYRWTQNRDEAEDLVQDVLTRLVTRTGEMAAVDKLCPWLIRVLYRRFVDLYRRRNRCPVEDGGWSADGDCPLENHAGGRDPLYSLALRRALNRALADLDDAQRDTVLLHDVEGHSLIEVAEILDIGVGTVKSRLHRARKKLQQALRREPLPAARGVEV